MIIGRENNLDTSYEQYWKQLLYYLHYYLDIVSIEDGNAEQKAKIVIRWIIFPNKEHKKDFKLIENEIGKKTHKLICRYTTCILQLLGKICECIIIDRCIRDRNCNIILMNIALLKDNIYNEYSDVEYDKYLPYSSSFKRIYYLDEDGYLAYMNTDYNPHHTSKDISWCQIGNSINQLKLNIEQLDYLENAKLQIKASTSYKNLDCSKYFGTPIIYFDLLNDFENLTLDKRYSKYNIHSARNISHNMMEEAEHYFKILAAYATGMISTLDIEKFKITENKDLEYVFRTPLDQLLSYRDNNTEEIINALREFGKPIRVDV